MGANRSYHYTLQDINRYLSGSMTQREMHDIEKAALSDPLLADAIDGYRDANPATTTKQLLEIAHTLQNENRKQGVIIKMQHASHSWKRWVIAASVTGILGVGAWIIMNDNKREEITSISAPQIADTSVITIIGNNRSKMTTPDTLQNDIAPEEISVSAKNITKKNVMSDAAPKKIASEATIASTPGISYTDNSSALHIADALQLKAEQQGLTDNGKSNSKPIILRGINNNAVASDPARSTFDISNVVYNGKITNEKGKPIAGASVVWGNAATITGPDGKFELSQLQVTDSLSNVVINAAGYKNESATLFAGRTAGIALQPETNRLDEVVIIGHNNKKKSALGRYDEMKVDTAMYNVESPFPNGGWADFYDNLAEELGVNRQKATKLLHLKFFIEADGKPTNFTIIKTPDIAIADRAIAAIKGGPRWKNFVKRNAAEIKLNVE